MGKGKRNHPHASHYKRGRPDDVTQSGAASITDNTSPPPTTNDSSSSSSTDVLQNSENNNTKGTNNTHSSSSNDPPSRNVFRYSEEERKNLYRNANFERYYKAQGIIPDHEWDNFIATLQRPLPLSFRINPLSSQAQDVQDKLHTVYAQPFVTEGGNEDSPPIPPPTAIPWYPENLAYQIGIGKPELKKNPSLRSFHEWLINLTDSGTITRQETVSMIPPLLLRVEPHHNVLDMCAAPGSKTTQLIEALHSGEKQNIPATGMIIANDADSKRAYLLSHQVNRLNSAAIVVTCHDAQSFPTIGKSFSSSDGTNISTTATSTTVIPSTVTTSSTGSDNSSTTENIKSKYTGFFDRILCDVPCSGDGTGRKNADVFIDWTPLSGASLHPLQLQIAIKGLALLKVGGYMAYSTCSLNPTEDEAVICELLRRTEGSVELVDVSSYLPDLKYSPGVSTWKVFDKFLNHFATFDDCRKPLPGSTTITPAAKKILPSMFPPAPEIAASYHLERCMRVLPHAQDTGGFFICLLHKKAPLPMTRHEARHDRYLSYQQSDKHQNNTSGTNDTTTLLSSSTTNDESTTTNTNDADMGTDDANKSSSDAAKLSAPPGPSNVWSVKRQRDMDGSFQPVSKSTVAHDMRGRPLVGRYETTMYTNVDTALFDRIKDMYGINDTFPMHQLYTRSESSRCILLVNEPVGKYVIQQQHLTTSLKSSGLVRIINTGIKIFQECKGDKFKYPHPRVAEANNSNGRSDLVSVTDNSNLSSSSTATNTAAGPSLSTVPSTTLSSSTHDDDNIVNPSSIVTSTKLTATDANTPDYRISYEGLIYLLPYLTRQVVYASGKEITQLLQYSGQFVSSTCYSPRLQYALNFLNFGSFVIVLDPALDGYEEDTEGKYTSVLDPIFDQSTYNNLPYYDGSLKPRSVVPVEQASLIPPILRSHYILSNGQGNAHDVVNSSSPSSSSSSSLTLLYQPMMKVWTGNDPASRVVVPLWKGITKYNTMAHNIEVNGLRDLLKAAGYA